MPTYIGDCSASGKASLTGADISLKQITKETKLKAKIELQVCHLIREMVIVPFGVFMSGFGENILHAMPTFVLLSEEEKNKALSKSRDPIEVAEARTSGPVPGTQRLFSVKYLFGQANIT